MIRTAIPLRSVVVGFVRKVKIRNIKDSSRTLSSVNSLSATSPMSLAPITTVKFNETLVSVFASAGITEEEVSKAVNSTPFNLWKSSLLSPNGLLFDGGNEGANCHLSAITIQGVDMFGSRVGFVKFKADIVDSLTGAKLPGIVFARGGAVGILILLNCEGSTYAVLVEQARVPIGRLALELPAGMLDDDAGDFVGTAAREVEEEVGIKIHTPDLIDLTAFLDASTGKKMYPSPGGCDEDITLFLYRGKVSREVIDRLQGSETGLRSHGELIKVHVVPYEGLWRSSSDAKVMAAVALYEGAKREGLIQD